jgi:hypothetical protein
MVRRFTGALQNHYHLHKPKEATETSALQFSKGPAGHRHEDAMDEVEDFDLLAPTAEDVDDHAMESSAADEDDPEAEEAHSRPGWSDADLLRAAAAEAKAHAAKGAATAWSLGDSGNGSDSEAGVAAPMALLEELIASSPALHELHSLLNTALAANPKEGLLAPAVELVVATLQYCKRRRATYPSTCGQAGALLCRRLLREHVGRVVDAACLKGNGPTSPAVQVGWSARGEKKCGLVHL